MRFPLFAPSGVLDCLVEEENAFRLRLVNPQKFLVKELAVLT